VTPLESAPGALDGPVVLIVTGRNIDEVLIERARSSPETFPA
jgi:hypothetical protein